MSKIKVPVYQPFLAGNEKKYVNECLDSSWISSKGGFINQFESSFAKYVNAKYAASCNNGTVALHLALLALDIKSGDEVIVPTFTYIASVNCIKHANAIPVFVDSDPNNWQLDWKLLEEKITSKTKAIIIPHLYGGCCQIEKILLLAKRHNLLIIEDAAESLGCFYKGKHLGTFGDIGTFSFFGNKTITTGEGGMLVSNDEKIIQKVRHFKGQGLASLSDTQKQYPEYWHNAIGYNYRMTNICAAIGLAQLENVDKIISLKRRILGWYKQKLAKAKGFELFVENPDLQSSYWLISGVTKDEKTRDLLRKELSKDGVETRPFFFPAHTMPMYFEENKNQNFPVALELSKRGLNLPSYPALTENEIDEICQVMLKVLN